MDLSKAVPFLFVGVILTQLLTIGLLLIVLVWQADLHQQQEAQTKQIDQWAQGIAAGLATELRRALR